MKSSDNKTIKENMCDLLALTEYEGGDPVFYTKSDKELNDGLKINPEHSGYPVDDYE